LYGGVDINLFFDHSSDWLAADKYNRSDRITIAGHGSSRGIVSGDPPVAVDVAELATRIKQEEKYKRGIKIIELDSCHVGNGRYAQDLVNLLDEECVVYAPNCYTMFNYDTGEVNYYLHREQIPGLEETFEKGKLLKFVKE